MRDLVPAYHTVLEIEQEFPVLDLIYCNEYVWPFIRCEIAGNLFNLEEGNEQENKYSQSYFPDNPLREDSLSKFLFGLSDQIKVDGQQFDMKALFLSLGHEHTAFNNFFYNKWLDPLKELLLVDKVQFLDLDMTDATSDIPKLFVNTHIKTLKDSVLSAPPNYGEIAKIEEFLRYLNSKNIYIGLHSKFLVERLDAVIALKRFFQVLLNIYKPKASFFACFYSYYAYALSMACRDSDVLSVDIQHGILEETDPFYGTWSKMPPGGYSMLPKIVWSWGEESGSVIDSWNSSGTHTAVVGGNPWVGRNIENNATLQKNKTKTSDNIEILFTCCRSPYKDIRELFPAALLDAIKNSPADVFWKVRTHYKMDVETCKKISDLLEPYSNYVEIQKPDSMSFLDALLGADYHATLVSTTALEAEAMGVPNIIVSEVGMQHYENDIAKGHYLYARDGDSFLSIIKNKTQPKLRSRPKTIVSKAIRRESLFNILDLLP